MCVYVRVALKPPRKSNCVKEVERLKKNREERRFVIHLTLLVIFSSGYMYYLLLQSKTVGTKR